MAIIEAYGLTKDFGQIRAVEDLSLALGIGVVDIIVLRIAVRLFQRESIVVKWH